MTSSSQKILVIGGAGFLGSHVADQLSELGHDVTVYDRTESPYLREDQNMITGDLSFESINAAMHNMDIVFHFAAIADIHESNKDPYSTVNANVLGAVNVFEAARTHKISKLLYASSMYVYSDSGGFYRATKQAAETLLKAYFEKYNLPYTVLRYGSLYGPRSQPWNGLNKYITEIMKTDQITYRGNGEERREYIHIVDAARITAQAIDSRYDNKSLLITGQQSLASKQILELIFEILGKNKNINFENNDHDTSHYRLTPYRYKPDIAVKLNPDHFIDFGLGIIEMIEQINTGNETES